jgi:hypothetical protein
MPGKDRFSRLFAHIAHAFLVTLLWETVLYRIGKILICIGSAYAMPTGKEPEHSGKAASAIGLLVVLVIGFGVLISTL